MSARPAGARRTVRVALGCVVVAHGLVHLLGAVAAWSPASVPTLAVPRATGVAWLAVAAVTVVAGVGLAAGRARWWRAGAVAVAGSVALVATAWPDAAAGLVPDAVLLAAVLHGWWCGHAASPRGRYRTAVAALTGSPADSPAGASAPPTPTAPTTSPRTTRQRTTTPVTDADVDALPPLVARWLRRTGAVGLPRVGVVRTTVEGRLRGGPDEPWMPFTGEQTNTFDADPVRLFLLDATRGGLPVDVLHVLRDGHATMAAHVLGVVPVMRGSGPDLDRSEVVTVLDDLCLLAPAALVDAPVTWQDVDAHRVRATYRTRTQQVDAVLTFDDAGDLREVASDDRGRASADGRTSTPTHWSTPVDGVAVDTCGRRVVTGRARWHGPGAPFTYAEMTFTVERT